MTKNYVAVVGRPVRIVLILLIATTVCPSAIFADEPPEILWNKTIPASIVPPPFPGFQLSIQGRGVAIGPDRNPVAVGQIALGPSPFVPSTAVVLVKYNRATGSEIWRSSSLRVPLGLVGGVAIDSQGTIFVGGHGLAQPSGLRYFVAKFKSDGTFVTNVFIQPPELSFAHADAIGGIAVGPDGNPVLTGITQFPSGGTFNLLTVKVSGLTLRVLAQALARFDNVPSEQKEAGVAVASSNEIFVTGTRAGTIKYNGNLSATPLWTRPVQGRKIAVRSGNVNENDSERRAGSEHQQGDREGEDEVAIIQTTEVCRGRVPPPGCTATQDFKVTRLEGDSGATAWIKIYGSSDQDVPRAVAIDPDGNILVTGERRGLSPQFTDGQTVSFDPEGVVNWVHRFNSGATPGPISADIIDQFFAVAVGRDSNPVVTGLSTPPSLMRTLKFDVHRHGQEGGARDEQR